MFQQFFAVLEDSSSLSQRLPPVSDLLHDWRLYAAVVVVVMLLVTATGGRRKPMGIKPVKAKKSRQGGFQDARMHNCPRCGNAVVEAVDDKPNKSFHKDASMIMRCTKCKWHD